MTDLWLVQTKATRQHPSFHVDAIVELQDEKKKKKGEKCN